MAEKLSVGDVFPPLELELVAGGRMAIPRDLETDYTFLVFFRGHW